MARRVHLPLLAFLLVFLVYPVLVVLALALREQGGAASLTHFRTLASDPLFWRAASNNLLLPALSVALEMVLGLALALLFRQRFPARGVLRTIAILPYAVPEIVFLTAMRYVFAPRGYANAGLLAAGLGPIEWLSPGTWLSFATVAVVDAWHVTPIVFLILLAGLEAIPPQLLQAAELDGGSGWQRLRYVLLPLLRPSLWTALVLRGLDALRIFATPLVLTGTEGVPVLSSYAYHQWSDYGDDGAAAAASVCLGLLSVALAAPLLGRRNVQEPVAAARSGAALAPLAARAVSPHARSRAAPPLSRGRQRHWRQRRVALYVALAVIVAAVDLLPLLLIAKQALTPEAESLAWPPSWLPRQWSLAHFRELGTGLDLAAGAQLSFAVGLMTVALTLSLAAPAAWLAARNRRVDRQLELSLTLARLLPPLALAVPLAALFVRFGIYNRPSGIGLALAHTLMALPFAYFLLRNGFGELPGHLDEAAALDGATPARMFWHIHLRLIRPALAAAAMLVFVLSWDDLGYALLLQVTNRPLPSLLYFFSAFGYPGVASAIAVVMLVPAVGIILVLQGSLQSGGLSGSHR